MWKSTTVKELKNYALILFIRYALSKEKNILPQSASIKFVNRKKNTERGEV